MRLRPYRKTDVTYIQKWITHPRTHAKWCANLLPYQFREEEFEALRMRFEADRGDSSYTALDEAGNPVGFFNMSIKCEENYGYLGFIVVDASKRGQGFGKQMLQLALKNAFEIVKLKEVYLSVFENNEAAFACYQRVGFHIQEQLPDFAFENENWIRYRLRITKEEWEKRQ